MRCREWGVLRGRRWAPRGGLEGRGGGGVREE